MLMYYFKNEENNKIMGNVNVLGVYSTEELQRELDNRDDTIGKLEIVPAETMWADFTCPVCGCLDSVDVDFLEGDGTVEVCCSECNCAFEVEI